MAHEANLKKYANVMLGAAILLFFLALLSGAWVSHAASEQKTDTPKGTKQGHAKIKSQPSEQSIGDAAMLPDKTIVMRVYANYPFGGVGEGEFTYKVTDPGYDEVLRHLGGLKPGESKPVPPWPKEDNRQGR
jgi:hypothetical protein